MDDLRHDYGEWIDTYTDPLPDRYHAGLKGGQLLQAGFILTLMARSLVDRDGYDTKDFCRRMDEELFPLLDGTPMNGPGGYASQSICEVWKVSIVYGMPCAIYHQLPAAYYLAARFHNDFESAVLHAVNGGGQNQARAILTGALTGAQTGLSNIPKRFIDVLAEATVLGKLATALATNIE